MKKIFICFIVFLLSVFVGWCVGVNQGGGDLPPSSPDTVYVIDTLHLPAIETPGTIIVLQDSLGVDSLNTILEQYYSVVDSLFKRVSILATMDSITDTFNLSVSYDIPKNSFNIGLTIFNHIEYITKPTFVQHKLLWWENFSAYISTDLDVGIGYSAFSLSKNLNDNSYKLNFNPRVSDITNFINRK